MLTASRGLGFVFVFVVSGLTAGVKLLKLKVCGSQAAAYESGYSKVRDKGTKGGAN